MRGAQMVRGAPRRRPQSVKSLRRKFLRDVNAVRPSHCSASRQNITDVSLFEGPWWTLHRSGGMLGDGLTGLSGVCRESNEITLIPDRGRHLTVLTGENWHGRKSAGEIHESMTAASRLVPQPYAESAGKRVSASHPPCKSELMLLCEKFRDRFFHAPKGPGCRIDLNECASVLGVARRRLYDITIVYEAAEVPSPLLFLLEGLTLLSMRDRRGSIASSVIYGEHSQEECQPLIKSPCNLRLLSHALLNYAHVLLDQQSATKPAPCAAHIILTSPCPAHPT